MPFQGRVKPIPQIKQETVWKWTSHTEDNAKTSKKRICWKQSEAIFSYVQSLQKLTRMDLLSAATHIIIIIIIIDLSRNNIENNTSSGF